MRPSLTIGLGSVSSLKQKSVQCISINERKVLLVHVANRFYALDHACPHKSASLCDGELDGYHIACPWHGARFNIKTGECFSPFAPKGIQTWPLNVQQGELLIQLPG